MYGIIVGFGGPVEAIPDGWKLCDGRLLSAAAYPEAYQAIGRVWGPGNPAGWFQLPDLAGYFLRGVDMGGLVDPDTTLRVKPDGASVPSVGTFQDDAIQGHTHEAVGYVHTAAGFRAASTSTGGHLTGTGPLDVSGPVLLEAEFGEPRVAHETRPRNAAVHWIIYVGTPAGVESDGVPVERLPDGQMRDARGGSFPLTE